MAAESDMDLDLLAESDSDSESSHSNQDNASIQRSAITAATAGSDVGMGVLLFACFMLHLKTKWAVLAMFFICMHKNRARTHSINID